MKHLRGKICLKKIAQAVVRKNKCFHDWSLEVYHPYMVMYGVGNLKCNKCSKRKTIWSSLEGIIYGANKKIF